MGNFVWFAGQGVAKPGAARQRMAKQGECAINRGGARAAHTDGPAMRGTAWRGKAWRGLVGQGKGMRQYLAGQSTILILARQGVAWRG